MADKVRVGDVCVVERRFGHALDRSPPQHRWTKKVVRVTKKRAYLDTTYLEWFALDDPNREVKPRYLDYRTLVVSVNESDAKE